MNYVKAKSLMPQHILLRKSEAYTILDEICRELELTPTQYEAAKANYEAVGAWLSASDDPVLKALHIYAHGSTALGTTVKPITREEHDVDLICDVLDFSSRLPPGELKKIIGDRLHANARYAPILEEKKRCWRLNYAREFHLDISPAIPNPACKNGGELVPDKQLRDWKPTNPKGYRALFDQRAALMPRLRLQKTAFDESRASVETFPSRLLQKGVLRRIVQLLKRHRDIAFQHIEGDIAPISIIITTLAAKAYAFCVGQFDFDTELDVVCATIRLMPHFIERPVVSGRTIYLVPNETTRGENFAERWNSEPERARAFYSWQEQALKDFENIASLEGVDLLTESLAKALGEQPVNRVLGARIDTISKAREAKQLFVAPSVGLTLSHSAEATPVPRNTHFGD